MERRRRTPADVEFEEAGEYEWMLPSDVRGHSNDIPASKEKPICSDFVSGCAVVCLCPANVSSASAECADYQSNCHQRNVLIDTAVIEQAIKTRVNDPFVERNIYDDRQAIYDLGYFYNVEVRIEKIVEK